MLAKGTRVKWPIMSSLAWAEGVVVEDEDKDGNVLLQPASGSTWYPGVMVQPESRETACANPDEPEQSKQVWRPVKPLIARCAAAEVRPS